MKALDIEAVQAFVLVADLKSFTRAAAALDTTQAAISLKLKRLEDRLGLRLLERTPRQVRLSAQGASFIEAARDLLSAHERAVSGQATVARRLTLGIADHVAGPNLPALLAHLNAHAPALMIEVRIDASRHLIASYDRGEIDAAIVRRENDRRDGELLAKERYGWFAAPSWQPSPNEPLRLGMLASPCGVRAIAIRALDAAGIPWIEAFVGGGVTAVGAAVMAGLAVAPLVERAAPVGAVDVGKRLNLPVLPVSEIILHSSIADPRTRDAVKIIAAAFKVQ